MEVSGRNSIVFNGKGYSRAVSVTMKWREIEFPKSTPLSVEFRLKSDVEDGKGLLMTFYSVTELSLIHPIGTDDMIGPMIILEAENGDFPRKYRVTDVEDENFCFYCWEYVIESYDAQTQSMLVTG